MIVFLRVVGLGILLVLVAACGAFSEPTPVLNPTRTPLSTALPELATIVPAGQPQNPLQLYIVPKSPAAASALETRLEDALLAATDGQIAVDIRLVADEATALRAVCTAEGGYISAAWVDGITYSAIAAQDCGNAQMQQQRGDTTGEAGVILLNRQLGNQTTAVVQGRTFCRLNRDSFYSWLLPVLMLRVEDIQIDEIGAIRDYDSYDALLTATANGDCAAMGMPQSLWDMYEADDDERAADVLVADTSVEMPFGVLVMAFDTPGTTRRQLTAGLLEFDAPEVTIDVTELPPPTETPTIEVTAEVTGEATAEVTEEGTPAATRTRAFSVTAVPTGATPTPEPTMATVATATPEPTEEATPEVTPEVTGEATPEATPEAETISLIAPFFGEGQFVEVQTGDFDALRSFLQQTGLDLEQLGQ